MMKKIITIICVFILYEAKSQSFITTDIVNLIVLRPNIGYDYRWKNYAFTSNFRYQTNYLDEDGEIPSFMRTNGFNIDLSLRKIRKNSTFTEFTLRVKRFEKPLVNGGFQFYTLHYSKNRIGPLFTIGKHIEKNKRFHSYLSVGLGTVFTSKRVYVGEYDIFSLSDKQILEKFPRPKGIEPILNPILQIRLNCKLGKL
jgi:hypothetical protein